MLPSHEDRRPRLLLVDDEPTNLHVLRQILGDDYRLQFATDGPKALQLVKLQKPDLILLDIMMPTLSGYDVCRQLKAHPQTQDIPVIFVSALSEMGDETEGFEAGGVDYSTTGGQVDDITDQLEEFKQKIISGEITVPSEK